MGWLAAVVEMPVRQSLQLGNQVRLRVHLKVAQP